LREGKADEAIQRTVKQVSCGKEGLIAASLVPWQGWEVNGSIEIVSMQSMFIHTTYSLS
jgi:hypothetical protein